LLRLLISVDPTAFSAFAQAGDKGNPSPRHNNLDAPLAKTGPSRCAAGRIKAGRGRFPRIEDVICLVSCTGAKPTNLAAERLIREREGRWPRRGRPAQHFHVTPQFRRGVTAPKSPKGPPNQFPLMRSHYVELVPSRAFISLQASESIAPATMWLNPTPPFGPPPPKSWDRPASFRKRKKQTAALGPRPQSGAAAIPLLYYAAIPHKR